MTVGLILSSAYIQTDLMAEFGLIPPAFLPLGNRRLYTYQADLLKNFCDAVYLSLPSDFVIPRRDVVACEGLGLMLVRCSPSHTIAGALAFILEEILQNDESLVLLHGDTLYQGLENIPKDFYAVHTAVDEYKWDPAPICPHHAIDSTDKQFVVSGFFSLSSTVTFRNALGHCDGDIIEALRKYDAEIPLSMFPNGQWLDFGHIQTYYVSCGAITTERSFNSLEISQRSVFKGGTDAMKIHGEANWFEQLPAHMRMYTPAYLGAKRDTKGVASGYSTQNTYLSTLANIAVFGALNQGSWRSIFYACKEFLDKSRTIRKLEPGIFSSDSYYLPKTERRLKQFEAETGFGIDEEITLDRVRMPSVLRMARLANEVISKSSPEVATLIHGDFCFSNIFYDFRSRVVKVIDPRGLDPDWNVTLFGDPRYDIAKLSHSVLGQYDVIICGDRIASQNGYSFEMEVCPDVDQSWNKIERAFHEVSIIKNSEQVRCNYAIMVHLFLSMLPLHHDCPSRQRTFIANAARLFQLLERV